MTEDERFMRRAVSLAARGGRAVSPNPMVGCVLVKNGRVVAEGWHKIFGGPHAEVEALRKAGPRARGATVYVTLEPCVRFTGKKTPSCAEALAKAGVERVVTALRDPNPKVAGKGLALLRRAGVGIRSGLMAKEARALNRGFFSRMRRGRPHVILKTALSLDGKAFAVGGLSKWITGPRARAYVHALRSRCDAVLIGIETVLADNPWLTARRKGKNPLRVVLDAGLRTPRAARILDDRAPTVIFAADRALPRGSAASERRGKAARTGFLPGAEVVRVPSRGGRLSLRSVLRELSRRGIGTLLVEGGAKVHASFLAERLVDEAYVFIAPKLLAGSRDPNRSPRLVRPTLKRVGPDFLFYSVVK